MQPQYGTIITRFGLVGGVGAAIAHSEGNLTSTS
jgi:hypothetical protein